MAHLMKHFHLVHDTAPFVPLPFHNPEVEEYPIQGTTQNTLIRIREFHIDYLDHAIPWPQ